MHRPSLFKSVYMRSVSTLFSIGLTFLLVVIAWVYFRATSLESAHAVLRGMAGLNGVILPESLEGRLGALGAALGISFGQLTTVGALFPPMGDMLALVGLDVRVTNVSVINAMVSLSIPLFLVFFLPNTYQIMRDFRPALEVYDSSSKLLGRRFALVWKPNIMWAVVLSFAAAYTIFGSNTTTRFLYFNF